MQGYATPAAAAIFIATIAISLLALHRMPELLQRFVMRPYDIAHGKNSYTVISSGFVHGDMGHLLFNMITFFFFAFPMERFLGTARFFVLYTVGLIMSSLCSVVKHRNNPAYGTLGASGAISAVLFAYVVYFPDHTLLIFFVPMPALLFAILYVAYSWYSARQQVGNINHDAHLCGALAGLLFVFVIDPQAYVRLANSL